MNHPNRQPVLDLTRHHRLIPSGDLVLLLTWIHNPDQDDYEPCMVIVPRYRKKGTYKACCVALSSAWQYNEPAYLAMASRRFAKMLGMDDNMSTVHKIGELLYSNLGELLKTPPSPTQSIVVADATYTVNGRTYSAEVLDHQPLAQA